MASKRPTAFLAPSERSIDLHDIFGGRVTAAAQYILKRAAPSPETISPVPNWLSGHVCSKIDAVLTRHACKRTPEAVYNMDRDLTRIFDPFTSRQMRIVELIADKVSLKRIGSIINATRKLVDEELATIVKDLRLDHDPAVTRFDLVNNLSALYVAYRQAGGKCNGRDYVVPSDKQGDARPHSNRARSLKTPTP